MPYKSLSDFVVVLEKEQELIRIKEFVNPELEITEITDRFSKLPGGGKALLFENTGTEFPLLINAFGSERRMCLALGINNLDDPAEEIKTLFRQLTSPKKGFLDKVKSLPLLSRLASYMPKKAGFGKAACQEVIDKNPDLNKLPVLKCWPFDGGRFVTLPMVITKNPESGIRNVGMYRMQVMSDNTTGMHWHRHKTGAGHYKLYKKRNEKMPVAVALGGDPVYTYAATAPLPDNVDEFMFAGFLRKKPIKLVKAITQDIEVPADADIIIEGYIDPNEEMALEGPFGDHTGYYSLADYYPVFHVTCITHRKNAIYPATIVGIPPMEDAWIAKATERIFLPLIQTSMLPELKNMIMPPEGVAHNLVILEIEKNYPGHAKKVVNALWGAGQMMFNKYMVLTDQKIPLADQDFIHWVAEIALNINPLHDISFVQGPMDILDHASERYSYGGKASIDATKKMTEEFSSSHGRIPNKFDWPKAVENIKKKYPEIDEISFSLCKNGIPVAIATINPTVEFSLDQFENLWAGQSDLSFIKAIILVSTEVDISDFHQVIWIIGNNSDPVRDSKIVGYKNGLQPTDSCWIIDASRKDKQFQKADRAWPNVIVSDEKTIEAINQKWGQLTNGPFINSPSNRYKRLVISEGATIF